jgi:hypothetical protein
VRLTTVAVLPLLLSLACHASAQVLAADNFDDGNTVGWTLLDGQFSVVNGALQVTSTTNCGDARAFLGSTTWTDYAIDVDFYIDSAASNRHASILFRTETAVAGCDAGRYYQFHIFPGSVGICRINFSGGNCSVLTSNAFSTSNFAWHHLRLEVVGTSLTATIDGQPALSYQGLTHYPAGFVGLKAINGNTNRYDNLVVTQLPGTPASYVPYGGGCGGGPLSLGAVSGSLPIIGRDLRTRIDNVAGPLAIGIVGFSDTAYGAYALPLQLGGFGMPQCSLYADPLLSFLLLPTSGSADWNFAIPAVTEAIGLRFYQQAFAVETTANATGVVSSNGGAALIGTF